MVSAVIDVAASSDQASRLRETVEERPRPHPPDEDGEDQDATDGAAPRPGPSGHAPAPTAGGEHAVEHVQPPRPPSGPSPRGVRRRSRAASRSRARRPASRSQAPRDPGERVRIVGRDQPSRQTRSAAAPAPAATPPTSVATTGSPAPSASVTTMPYASRRDGRTSRSARPEHVGHGAPRPGGPASGPGRRTGRRRPDGGGRRRTHGSRSRDPTSAQVHGRSAMRVSASTSRSCPLCRATAPTHSNRPPSCVPGASSRRSAPGRATATRSGGSPYRSRSRCRVQALVVTTAAAQARTRASSASGTSTPPSGMCTSTTSRSRSASGTSTEPAAEATNPSTRTRAPSGEVGRGRAVQRPGRRRPRRTSQPRGAQAVADPPVVGVAAARPREVVDATGDDEADVRAHGPPSLPPGMNRILAQSVSAGVSIDTEVPC